MLISPHAAASRQAPRYICLSCSRKLSSSSFVKPPSETLRPSGPSKLLPWHQYRRWISQNYIKKMMQAEDDFSKRAEDIKAGRKRSVMEVLEERGFINQVVGDPRKLKMLFDNRRVGVYAGIDPTASSMHVGHMVPFMALSWLYVHGYSVYFLLGGATAGIGDPEGRLTAREALGNKERRANIATMHLQLKRFGETMEKYAGRRGYMKEWSWRRHLINNSAWHNSTPITEWMRLMGKGVRLGPMLGRDSVKNRLEKGDGMSFAEFCYPLVQAWDWWELFQKGVQVQIGGADQFGNILQGAEAVKYAALCDTPFQVKLQQEKQVADWTKRDMTVTTPDGKQVKVAEDALGFTVPLLTTTSGEKFGKSAGNAIWLDADLTPPFELYQFFLRSADADVERYLNLFTFLPLDEITSLMAEHAKDRSKRIPQHKLASEFVELIHGLGAAQEAERGHRQLFNKNVSIAGINASIRQTSSPPGKFDFARFHPADPPDAHPSLNKHAPPQTLEKNMSSTCTLPRSLVIGQNLNQILWSAGLVASKSEGHRLIVNGGVYIGGSASGKEAMQDYLSYTPADQNKSKWEELQKFVIDDELLVLRTGKWKVKIVKVVSDEVFREKRLTAPGWEHESSENTAWNAPLESRYGSFGTANAEPREQKTNRPIGGNWDRWGPGDAPKNTGPGRPPPRGNLGSSRWGRRDG